MKQQTNQKIIEFNNVSFSYTIQPVLSKASFSINKNDFVGIIGPNGGGKTTIINLIFGFLKPNTGEIKVFGEATGIQKNLKRIGYVPQKATNFDQNFPATVFEVVSMGRFAKTNLTKQLTDEDKKIVKKALTEVGMLETSNKRIGDLSGGQQQRVFIARALASEPEVLILDEPFSGVDMDSQQKFYQLLKKLHEKKGLTILLVSHDIGMVSKQVTKLACVNLYVTIHDTSKGIHKKELTCSYLDELNLIPHHHDEEKP